MSFEALETGIGERGAVVAIFAALLLVVALLLMLIRIVVVVVAVVRAPLPALLVALAGRSGVVVINAAVASLSAKEALCSSLPPAPVPAPPALPAPP